MASLPENLRWADVIGPRTDVCKHLLCTLQTRIRDCLRQMLQEIERVTGARVGGQLERVTQLDDLRRFRPEIFAAYFALLDGMARGDRGAIARGCKILEAVLQAPYRDERSILRQMSATVHDVYRNIGIPIPADGVATMSIDDAIANRVTRNVEQAREILAEHDRPLANELDTIVSTIQFVPEWFFAQGMSTIGLLGLIAIRAQDSESSARMRLCYFDLLVHEGAHQYLNLLMTFNPLVKNGHQQVFSPLRAEVRPLKGVLHAQFVLFRLLLAYRNARSAFATNDHDQFSLEDLSKAPAAALPFSYEVRYAAYREKFRLGDLILREHADVTEAGRAMLDGMREMVAAG